MINADGTKYGRLVRRRRALYIYERGHFESEIGAWNTSDDLSPSISVSANIGDEHFFALGHVIIAIGFESRLLRLNGRETFLRRFRSDKGVHGRCLLFRRQKTSRPTRSKNLPVLPLKRGNTRFVLSSRYSSVFVQSSCENSRVTVCLE